MLIGYLHGVAIVTRHHPAGKLLGLDVDATEPLRRLAEISRELDDVSGATIAVDASRSLSALLALRAGCRSCPAR